METSVYFEGEVTARGSKTVFSSFQIREKLAVFYAGVFSHEYSKLWLQTELWKGKWTRWAKSNRNWSTFWLIGENG